MVSAEPEARIFLCDLLREMDKTESVWLPSFHFLAELVNFLGFFLFVTISPPKMTSG